MNVLRGVHVSPHAVAVTMLAVARLDRPTVRSVAAATGYGVSTTHGALSVLRDEGLVVWEPGRRGTLRAAAEEVTRPWEPDPWACLAMSVLEPTEGGWALS